MSGQLDVWVADLRFPEEADLPPQDLQRAEGFLRAEATAHWLAARGALRRVLSEYLGEPPAAIEIEEGENGKPQLVDGGLEFNLSHSGDFALIAVSREGPVGVDVERIVPGRNPLALAERALGEEDVARVRDASAAERDAVFYDCWVRHEAKAKCLGTGLTAPIPNVSLTVEGLDVAPGYAAAVAIKAPGRSRSASASGIRIRRRSAPGGTR